MTDQHPIITPPPELVQQWMNEIYKQWMNDIYNDPDVEPQFVSSDDRALAARAAQYGADQELEACCEWMSDRTVVCPSELRAARRPKPPSLKEQALALLDPSNTYGSITQEEEYRISVTNADTIRRALEALPDD